jgi:two-component system sensor histidine kinase/response regulator
MNAIIGFSDMLVNEEFTDDEKKEFIGIIKTSGDTLLKLIDDIIDISLIEAGQLKTKVATYNLNYLIREIHRFFQGEKERQNKHQIDIKLSVVNFDETITIEADQVRFRQILTNLIGNALKFTESGFIEIGYDIFDKKTLSVYVKDTGIGIHKDKIDTVFERFSKLDDERKLYSGTGLGLTISKKLVEQMGGNLTVESEFGVGSIFRFTLPYKNENIAAIEPSVIAGNAYEQYNWKDKSLLIVEDVDSNYHLIEKALKKTGITLKWAKDGQEALAFCQDFCPDAVLMDIQLPGKSGYEVTREILDMYPKMPIIAQSAYAFNNEKERILEVGCVAYITKPIKSKVLYETINKYIV